MKGRIRIDGVYDLRTVSYLQDLGVRDIGTDFRPRSFNFLQHYRFMELLESTSHKNNKYYLRHENEADFIVQRVVGDIRRLLDVKGGHALEDFFLEFSDAKTPSYYDSFGMGYLWHFRPEKEATDILESRHIKGIVLTHSFLERLQVEGNYANFVGEFLKKTLPAIRARRLTLILQMDWDSDVATSLVEFLDFDLVALPINSKVETGYRNVDFPRFSQSIRNLLRVGP